MLLGLVAIGAALVVVVRPPVRLTGLDAVRGHHVFGVRGPVQAVEVTWEGRRLSARRAGLGWEVDGAVASPGTADALEDLVATLVRLRALDAFRAGDGAAYGLDRPRGTIALVRAGGTRRIVVGETNAAGSAFYARRDGEARVLQLGTGLGSAVERVLYHRDHQRPETG